MFKRSKKPAEVAGKAPVKSTFGTKMGYVGLGIFADYFIFRKPAVISKHTLLVVGMVGGCLYAIGLNNIIEFFSHAGHLIMKLP